ncbi:hypothetical protein Xph01_37760 [Micromonospora phaseoli]|nr:hypothetical protein Xph01_37760 [Micromonospora phaseoli]
MAQQSRRDQVGNQQAEGQQRLQPQVEKYVDRYGPHATSSPLIRRPDARTGRDDNWWTAGVMPYFYGVSAGGRDLDVP